jgi:hypothetical protein
VSRTDIRKGDFVEYEEPTDRLLFQGLITEVHRDVLGGEIFYRVNNSRHDIRRIRKIVTPREELKDFWRYL